MGVALIKFRDGINVGSDGVAFFTSAGQNLIVENATSGAGSDIGSWRISLVAAPPGSSRERRPFVDPYVTIAENSDSDTPQGTLLAIEANPGCYRIVLEVWSNSGYTGNKDTDIRNGCVRTANLLFVIPPYQLDPSPLPKRPTDPGYKPNELNFPASDTGAGQNWGWSGPDYDAASHQFRMLDEVMRVLDAIAGGTDANAIHDNVAGEILAIAEKVTPVAADLILIEDSQDSSNKKRVQAGNLPSGSATDPNAIHSNVSGEIAGVSAKGSPVAADLILIEDSQDSNSKKRVTVESVQGNTDPNAIHSNVSGEIAGVSAKGSPVAADLILIEDSQDSNSKKRITISSMPPIDHGSTTGLGDDDHGQYVLGDRPGAGTKLAYSNSNLLKWQAMPAHSVLGVNGSLVPGAYTSGPRQFLGGDGAGAMAFRVPPDVTSTEPGYVKSAGAGARAFFVWNSASGGSWVGSGVNHTLYFDHLGAPTSQSPGGAGLFLGWSATPLSGTLSRTGFYRAWDGANDSWLRAESNAGGSWVNALRVNSNDAVVVVGTGGKLAFFSASGTTKQSVSSGTAKAVVEGLLAALDGYGLVTASSVEVLDDDPRNFMRGLAVMLEPDRGGTSIDSCQVANDPNDWSPLYLSVTGNPTTGWTIAPTIAGSVQRYIEWDLASSSYGSYVYTSPYVVECIVEPDGADYFAIRKGTAAYATFYISGAGVYTSGSECIDAKISTTDRFGTVLPAGRRMVRAVFGGPIVGGNTIRLAPCKAYSDLESEPGDDVILHQVVIHQDRAETLTNLARPDKPIFQTTDENAPLLLNWDYADPAGSVPGGELLYHLHGGGVAHSSDLRVPKAFEKVRQTACFYVVLRRFVTTGTYVFTLRGTNSSMVAKFNGNTFEFTVTRGAEVSTASITCNLDAGQRKLLRIYVGNDEQHYRDKITIRGWSSAFDTIYPKLAPQDFDYFSLGGDNTGLVAPEEMGGAIVAFYAQVGFEITDGSVLDQRMIEYITNRYGPLLA